MWPLRAPAESLGWPSYGYTWAASRAVGKGVSQNRHPGWKAASWEAERNNGLAREADAKTCNLFTFFRFHGMPRGVIMAVYNVVGPALGTSLCRQGRDAGSVRVRAHLRLWSGGAFVSQNSAVLALVI